MDDPHSTPSSNGTSHWQLVKLLVLVAILVVMGVLFLTGADALSWDNLVRQEVALRRFQERRPWGVYGAAFTIYALVTGLSLPGAVPLTLLYGWFFGFWPAVLLVSFASTLGATSAFLLARFLFRDALLSRFGEQLQKVNHALRREGAYYLFTLRLIPVVPFWVLNLVMGLTPMSVGTYWGVSQLGMLPGTCLYVYAGHSVPDLQTLAARGARGILSPQVIAAFALLGLFPLITRKVLNAIRPPKNAPSDDSQTSSSAIAP